MTSERLNFQGTADLCDEHEDGDIQVCEPIFRDFGGEKAFSGEIVTLKCFEDNSKVREMLGTDGRGKVLVVDAGGSMRCAMLGDQLAILAVKNGWAGVVMYGCIRDSRACGALSLGVKAMATHPLKSRKMGVGQENIPVRFAGVEFRPGDLLFADEDGIVVRPG
ncbi:MULTISPECIES: ribonuclease E activity regulator RraA [Ectothiorhodospira]|uniref:ribonuclease E activity regulator RraA n=1 Tax=Ectothiorhodospira TaxID=1051 RepID=UPI0004A41B69|nr:MULTISPECIES: ribonuclease E activity regulator RraA [Ectothiorhodospira]MCG5494848.1 ribonuclease E activity regulator RraA [Ectothiorhodospira variabilis]MCG5497747.1 ribonuclease E activity regulator RraA [Ectothiorhodospira variabilis]MCG5504361.1 ribonuclease E activity regulator RraA [Ectothiorhodospira variabilis]MCG5507516.1 ribonuclease E activity regulator RraA [Ectothiorhodospira variabilis]MCG5525234.1 ribonuclease E activity regulator RraA [Ectothiorhodospira haloalkaliphila]